ncbi:MAG: class II SORL domain-containing protein [Candidatus Bathyarchaeota archaeon]|nr:class II SORL domain-containing protein [Candidatus Bathyarchaeum tardum]WGM90197.1 MAG: class II SORL domain-containing protein [Candidatus Bathyarchaeum tardum]
MSEDYSLTELNRPDWNNMTVMSKKHTPIIEAPSKVKADEPFAVKIKVGGIDGVEHPNTLSHWINWIALYAGKRLISKIDFGAELSDGYVVTINVSLKESANLHAQEFCNLHGVWEGKAVKVTVQ